MRRREPSPEPADGAWPDDDQPTGFRRIFGLQRPAAVSAGQLQQAWVPVVSGPVLVAAELLVGLAHHHDERTFWLVLAALTAGLWVSQCRQLLIFLRVRQARG